MFQCCSKKFLFYITPLVFDVLRLNKIYTFWEFKSVSHTCLHIFSKKLSEAINSLFNEIADRHVVEAFCYHFGDSLRFTFSKGTRNKEITKSDRKIKIFITAYYLIIFIQTKRRNKNNFILLTTVLESNAPNLNLCG